MPVERRQVPGAPKRVLLIGWDAADWRMIQPLVERGLMPTMAKLMEAGAWGNLASIQPMLSPMLWNTIATGKRASQHGVLGFTEPNPDAPGIRPTSSTSRKCKALWNILTQCGLKSNVVGWYASHPAEPINGVMVSNQFEAFQQTSDGITPPTANSIWPTEMADELAALRVRPTEIDGSAILPFIPAAAELLETKEHRVGKLQQMLAQTATIHAVATHLMPHTEWDFTSVYYEGIDRFGHEFMEFHPPKMDQISEDEFTAYQHCMDGIYRFHDMLLETLLTLAGDDTTILLLSDHGYYSNQLRPDPREGQSGPVDWHRPFGVLAAHGPGITKGSRLYGASLLDIAPTVLHLLGLPSGEDMPGRVLAEILSMHESPQRIFTWEEIEGECGMHDDGIRIDPVDAQEALQQLVALGYIEAPSEDEQAQVQNTIAHNQLTLAQSQADAQDWSGALESIGSIPGDLGNSSTVALMQANCLLAIGQRQQARQVLNQLVESDCESPRVGMMLGTLEFSEGNTSVAERWFRQIADLDPRLPGLHNKLGRVYLSAKKYAQAREAFEKALAIDSDSAVSYEGLAETMLANGEVEQALEHAMLAASLVHHFPRAHLTVGKAYLALLDFEGAVEALELCAQQAPGFVEAHQVLARAYRGLGDSAKAMTAEIRAKQLVGS